MAWTARRRLLRVDPLSMHSSAADCHAYLIPLPILTSLPFCSCGPTSGARWHTCCRRSRRRAARRATSGSSTTCLSSQVGVCSCAQLGGARFVLSQCHGPWAVAFIGPWGCISCLQTQILGRLLRQTLPLHPLPPPTHPQSCTATCHRCCARSGCPPPGSRRSSGWAPAAAPAGLHWRCEEQGPRHRAKGMGAGGGGR